jgi:lipopolysaccharide biosynthesis glycosyltransferase
MSTYLLNLRNRALKKGARVALRIAGATPPPAARAAKPASKPAAKSPGPDLDPLRADAELMRRIQRGEDFPRAVVGMVRAELSKKRDLPARSVCQALYDNPETRAVGALGAGIVAMSNTQRGFARDLFREAPLEWVARLAPAEYLRAHLVAKDTRGRDEAASWIDDGVVTEPGHLVSMAESFFAFGDYETSRKALDTLRALPTLSDHFRRRADHLSTFVERASHPGTPEPVPAGQVSFAVIDYKQPDWPGTSSNVGDYVQTIASLANVVRHDGLRFHGDPELVSFVDELKGRLRPELKIDGPESDVHLTLVNRDASAYDAVPENTWGLTFGWYAHPTFGLSYGLPFNKNINPLFISFHVNRADMLTPETIEHLKANGPIGCRDWYTTHLLLSRGVPAFFSGCITTTVNAVFPDGPKAGPNAPALYVDTTAPAGAKTYKQERDEVKWTPAPQALREALELLDSYRRDYSEVHTSRLHCYLPAWSIGANVTVHPKVKADVRFKGLLDVDDNGRNAIREQVREILPPVLSLMFSGAPAEDVYAEWARVTTPLVAEARAEFEKPQERLPLSFDIDEACSVARETRVLREATQPRQGEPVNVAVALDGNLKKEMEVVVGSMVRHSTRPLHVVAMTRDHSSEDHDRLSELFPEVTFEWIALDDVDYGPIAGLKGHITVSTMDRLLLPELLPDMDRILYHDLDAIPVVDIAELFDTDLEGAPLAARTYSTGDERRGLGNLNLGVRLRNEPELAHLFYRTMHRRHPEGFRSFNAGILVLDLATMRKDSFSHEFVPFVEHFGLDDQEVLWCYAGSTYRQLEDGWNTQPGQEFVEPKLIHWAGKVKPWKRESYIRHRDRWDESVAYVAERRG